MILLDSLGSVRMSCVPVALTAHVSTPPFISRVVSLFVYQERGRAIRMYADLSVGCVRGRTQQKRKRQDTTAVGLTAIMIRVDQAYILNRSVLQHY